MASPACKSSNFRYFVLSIGSVRRKPMTDSDRWRKSDASTGNPGGAWRMPVIFEWKTLRSLYGSKTQTAKVVLKSTWCSFCLKVQQRRAHDVSQVRRRFIFYTRVGVGKNPVRLEFLKICPPAGINLPSVTLPDSNRTAFSI